MIFAVTPACGQLENEGIASFPDGPQRALIKAVFEEDRSQILAAVVSGASPNFPASNGMTPLFWAFRAKSIDSFKALLEAGADPDIAVSLRRELGGETTILHFVAVSDDVRFIQALLDAGADPNVTDANQETALWPAIFYDRFDVLSLLVRYGADINHRSIGGNTPLLTAVQARAYGMAAHLIEHGADPSVENDRGWDVFDTLGRISAPRPDGPSRASYDALIQALGRAAGPR